MDQRKLENTGAVRSAFRQIAKAERIISDARGEAKVVSELKN
jgi:hypothetical protein